LKRTKKSKEAFDWSKTFLPGGNSRTTVFWRPHPVYFKYGKGFTIYDLDGNNYLDFIGNYTSLIHGHAHPKIVDIIQSVVERGTAIHMPTEVEIQLAKLMCERFPSVDKIRFTNSGTEAVMNAMRLARAYTRKDKIMKAEGAYHGTHPSAQVSVNPDLAEANPIESPNSYPGLGTSANVVKDVIIYPYNNQGITEKLLKKHKDELAAVLVEPVMRTIPPKDGFLNFIRELTSENDVLLIFDEVICARISKGGSQEFYDVMPDLTAFGKIFGGGLPFGAFGGRDDIMKITDPSKEGSMGHWGTFNANPVTMAAGTVATEMLTSEAINRLNSLGDVQRKGMEKVLDELGIIAKLTGVGSLATLHFTDEEVKGFRSSARAEGSLIHPLYISLLNNGISTATRIFTALSTPMSRKEVETFISIFRKSIEGMKPLIKEIAPNLIT
jgi:glutamate-1-semialdehyde 2,1-aminomutase